MRETTFESLHTRELDDTSSDLTQLEEKVNPLYTLKRIENNSQISYQEQKKRNDAIINKSNEINALYTTINEKCNKINNEYQNNKIILDTQTNNKINEINQKLENEAKIIAKNEISVQEANLKNAIQLEKMVFHEHKVIRQKIVTEDINNREKQIKIINWQIKEKEQSIKVIVENKDYQKWIEKQKNWKKLKDKEQKIIDEWITIQIMLQQLQSKKDAYKKEIEDLNKKSENIEQEEWEKLTSKINTLNEIYKETINQLIAYPKEQLRITQWIPSNHEMIIERENNDQLLHEKAKKQQEAIQRDYTPRIKQLESEIQSLKIDWKIQSLEIEQLENKKHELINQISWVAQPKIEVMNTTIIANSWLHQLLWTTWANNSKDQLIVDKNREEITGKANEISEKISLEIQPEDKKAIEDAILNHLKSDQAYQNTINTIILQWTQSWKNMEAIKLEIQEHNQSMIKKLFPVFLIEIEEGKIIVNRKNWSPVQLWNASKQLLAKNESYQTFKKLYEKFIENPFLDITDLNHLSREWIAENTATWLEKQLINAISTNRDIENFLFNNPQANPEKIHDNLGYFFEKPLSKKKQIKIAWLLWKILPENNTDNTPKNQINQSKRKKEDTKKTILPEMRKDEFLDKINTFTTKRINQSLLLWHCESLRETFWLVTSQWTKLVDAIAFDFQSLSIEQSGKNIAQNIVYHNLSSTLRITGTDWKVTIPNTLSSLRWVNEMRTITTLPMSLQKRKALLTKDSTLKEKELFACKNWSDVQTRITEKIRLAAQKNQSSLWHEQNKIAENLEKESMVMNFTNFMSGSVSIKNTEQINKNALSKNENNQESMKTMLQKWTQWKEWTLPMNLQELKELNTIFMDKKVQKLVDNQEWIPSDNRDKFMQTVWFYKRWVDASFTEIITFFSSLKDMAYSQVDHEHENWYIVLQDLLTKKWFHWELTYKKDHTIVIS
jgi:hypothetical protein